MSVKLIVNEVDVEINEFVSDFLENTITGMVKALKVEEIATLEIVMDTSKITLFINSKNIAINKFVSEILSESILGMVKSLKTEKFGIDYIKTINIKIKKWFYETY